MISKRSRRSGRPQENIRQFALNNSKGVDSSKSPTDFNTISAAKNLIVNPDGSMSLRKPLECVKIIDFSTNPTEVRRLYDGKHILKVSDLGNGNWSFSIHDEEGAIQRVRATCMGYDGNLITKDDTLLYFIVPNETVELLNLNTASVLGNCDIKMSYFGDKAIDYTLYDIEDSLPRYVHIYYAEDDGIWTVAVKQPELNTLTTAEGEIAFNPNMTLDNPTALRDSYNSVVPSIKGILAYVPSKIVNGSVVADDAVKLPTVSVVASPSTGTYETYIDTTHSREYSLTSTTNNLTKGTLRVDRKLKGDWKGYSYKVTISLDAHSGSDEDTYTFKIDGTCVMRKSGAFSQVKLYECSYTFEHTYTASVLKTPIEVELFKTEPWDYTIDDEYSSAKFTENYTWTESTFEDVASVNIITESNRASRYRIALALKRDATVPVFLKAFGNLPSKGAYYATWLKSSDGVSWENLDSFQRLTDGITVRELKGTLSVQSVEGSSETDYDNITYYPFLADSSSDVAFRYAGNVGAGEGVSYANTRIDIAPAAKFDESVPEAHYRFKVVVVERLQEEDPEYDPDLSDTQQYRSVTVAQQDYVPVFKNEFEFFNVDFGNAVYGKKLYHKKSIYSYGSEKFLNNIFVSDIDSFITPLYNIIDLDTYKASQATCIVPWRDYLISATENAIYLHSKQSEGFLTKTVNTSIGIPEDDSRCCKSILNGILFKSGPKIYQMYPNMYSGDDSTLNLTEISKPVEEYLEAYADYLKECAEEGTLEPHTPFAFSTDSEYILMLPNSSKIKTVCLRYNYSSKLWTACEYPIVAHYYEMFNLNDIRIFGNTFDWYAEFKFDSECSKTVYGDVLPLSELKTVPIDFEWDTGQKTDNISLAKQFVESKLVFATEDDLEFFPMELTVHVDGDPHVTTLDVNSDAPFWKTEDSKGVANTAFRLGSESDTGVFRQLIVRYSGKGRSVRHILRGSPTSNFRLYETYVRYKTLNIKR